MGFPIRFLDDGHFGRPIHDFLDALPPKDAAKAWMVLKFVQECDRVPAEYLKKMTGTRELWEVRVSFAGRLQRYLGIIDAGELVLLHAFVKKQQKTPGREIAVAEARARLYFLRKGRP